MQSSYALDGFPASFVLRATDEEEEYPNNNWYDSHGLPRPQPAQQHFLAGEPRAVR